MNGYHMDNFPSHYFCWVEGGIRWFAHGRPCIRPLWHHEDEE